MRPAPNSIWPRSGANAPASRLKMVVLPAPFGPIKPTISPSFTSKLTPATARSPRKAFSSCWTTSRPIGSALLRPRRRSQQQRPQTMGQKAGGAEQEHAVDDLLDAGQLDVQRGQQLGAALA